MNIFEAIFWKLLDFGFEKHVYVRTTNSITAIAMEWIFTDCLYSWDLTFGFDFHKITGFC